MSKSEKQYRNLQEWCVENNTNYLLQEWDYEMNGDIRPQHVAYTTSRKVWWKCPAGHSFESRVGNRTLLTRGCPYCSGRKVLQGFNDFETWCKQNNRQDLLQEWNYEKNGGLLPNEILQSGSNKKYWWKGPCGHEWDSVISSRVRERQGKTKIVKAAGCPYCSNPPKRVLQGFNDFETWCKQNNRQDLLQEWNYEKNGVLLPSMVTYGSGKSVWWICSKKHDWKTQISSRSSGHKTNCPICSRGQSSFPEQAVAYYLKKQFSVQQRIKISGLEVDIFLPEFQIAIEYDGKQWHKGFESQQREIKKQEALEKAGIRLIRLKEHDTLHCVKNNTIYFCINNGDYITNEFEWMLHSLFEIIENQHNILVEIEVNISNDEMNIRNYYMNTLRDNSVQALYPDLALEWDIEKNDGVTPDAYSAHNRKKVWWRCPDGHSWQASIVSRSSQKNGCPYCAGQRVLSGQNDLETWCNKHASSLLREWDYDKNTVLPSEIPRTYKEKVWWKCTAGHTWQATVYNRMNGTGCPNCNKGNSIKGGTRTKISLLQWCKENSSNLYLEWHPIKNGELTPNDVSYGSHTKVWWMCEEGHEWEAQIKSRTYNHGCPFCSKTNKKAIKGVNDLKTWCKNNGKTYIVEEWNYQKNTDLSPEEITPGSHKRIWWKCVKGHEWQAVIKERTKPNPNRCPICKRET